MQGYDITNGAAVNISEVVPQLNQRVVVDCMATKKLLSSDLL